MQRLFNPYTGADLGDPLQPGFRFILWLADLHDNLLYGRTGRRWNLVGGILGTLLCLTGAVIWWPGIENWRSSVTVGWKVNRKGFNWALHSALGFWSIAFVFMWGISGIYLSIPESFNAVVDFFEPIHVASKTNRFGDQVLYWLARLHFGRFAGQPVKIIWTVFGLAPAVLFVTGTLMWWNRVLGPWMRRGLLVRRQIDVVDTPHRDDSIHALNQLFRNEIPLLRVRCALCVKFLKRFQHRGHKEHRGEKHPPRGQLLR